MEAIPALNLGKVISGGQTGVDRSGLDWAIARGIPHGGYCPAGRRAEDGRIPDRYVLEPTQSRGYQARTRKNVEAGHGTLVIVNDEPTGGTLATIEYALSMMKPIYIVRLGAGDLEAEARKVLAWLRTHSIRILNVAGPRESTSPGIGVAARGFLDRLI